jgi:hypothetical protein
MISGRDAQSKNLSCVFYRRREPSSYSARAMFKLLKPGAPLFPTPLRTTSKSASPSRYRR